MKQTSQVATIAIALALAAWFLWHTWPGLFFGFSGDDMMNTYLAWDIPLPRIILANLTPFTEVYRPVGTAFYYALYSAAGFEPLPFRVACYALLLFNIAITYRFVKALTASAEVAVLSALIACYHPNLIDLYTNGGTVYDILCFTFLYAAVTVYIAERRRDHPFRLSRAVIFLALCVFALNSKEMSATLVAAVWAYEIVYTRPLLARRPLPLWILTAATPVALVVKRGSPAFLNNPDYALILSPDQFLLTTRTWISQLVFLPETTLGSTAAVAILVLPLIAGLVFRSKHLQFLGLLIVLLPLPVNFIHLRGFFVMYMPLVAWAACIVIPLVALRDRFSKSSAAQAALFAAIAAALFAAHAQDAHRSFEWADPSQANNRALHAALAGQCQNLPEGGHILLRDDGFEKGYHDPLFVARLTFHSKSVDIERTKDAADHPLTVGRLYDCVLAFDGSRYVRDSSTNLP